MLSFINEASIRLHVSAGEAMSQNCSSVRCAESQNYEYVDGAIQGRISQAVPLTAFNFLLPCILCLRADTNSMLHSNPIWFYSVSGAGPLDTMPAIVLTGTHWIKKW